MSSVLSPGAFVETLGGAPADRAVIGGSQRVYRLSILRERTIGKIAEARIAFRINQDVWLGKMAGYRMPRRRRGTTTGMVQDEGEF